jgi:Protein of unknown function (DUF3300)
MRVSRWIIITTFIIAFLSSNILIAQENTSETLSSAELEQLLAPIALYPDTLLAQVLMASTYPLEIVQASRWLEKNKNLSGEQLIAEAQKQDWDESVKSLVEFPDVVSMMNENLDWTTKLGDAFLAQQQDVMDSIQVLRERAEASGNLKTTKEQVVVKEKETIIIQPADPQIVYVPAYNPTVVYGSWYYPAYPPYAVYPPGYVASNIISFGLGIAVGATFASFDWGHNNCCYWGGGYGYKHGNTNININTGNVNIGNRKWQYNPEHRRGVEYNNKALSDRYQNADRNKTNRELRGYGESRPTTSDIEKGLRDRSDSGAFSDGQTAKRQANLGNENRQPGSRNMQSTERKNAGSAAQRTKERPRTGESGSVGSGNRSDAFSGYGSRSQTRADSKRGKSSRQSYQRSTGRSGPSRGGRR